VFTKYPFRSGKYLTIYDCMNFFNKLIDENFIPQNQINKLVVVVFTKYPFRSEKYLTIYDCMIFFNKLIDENFIPQNQISKLVQFLDK